MRSGTLPWLAKRLNYVSVIRRGAASYVAGKTCMHNTFRREHTRTIPLDTQCHLRSESEKSVKTCLIYADIAESFLVSSAPPSRSSPFAAVSSFHLSFLPRNAVNRVRDQRPEALSALYFKKVVKHLEKPFVKQSLKFYVGGINESFVCSTTPDDSLRKVSRRDPRNLMTRAGNIGYCNPSFYFCSLRARYLCFLTLCNVDFCFK